MLRLTSARAGGALGDEFDALIDRVARGAGRGAGAAGGVRGDARQALVDRLAALDAELRERGARALDEAALRRAGARGGAKSWRRFASG